MIGKVISGGQTGVDQAALRAARAAGIPTGGYAPKGWLTEDGPAPWLAEFGVVELMVSDYPRRTKANVSEAAGCLWFGNPHSPGGRLTLRLCRELTVDAYVADDGPRAASDWVYGHLIEPAGAGAVVALMVAGNRESSSPGIGERAEAFLREAFALLVREGGGR